MSMPYAYPYIKLQELKTVFLNINPLLESAGSYVLLASLLTVLAKQ
jgi:hypothetical protein